MYPKKIASQKLRGQFDTPEFEDGFPGTALNSGKWLGITSVLTIAVANGYARLNAGAGFANTNVARIQSAAFFSFIASIGKVAKFPFRLSQAAPPAGSVAEFGFLLATGVAAPTLGAFFRVTPAGGLQAVVNLNGAETAVSCKDANQAVIAPDVNAHVAWISYDDDQVEFWIDDVLVAVVATEAQITARTSSSIPFAARVYYASAGTVAQMLDIGHVVVLSNEFENSKPWGHTMAGMGHHAYQGQSGGTMGSSANFANSANPSAAVPSNTTAALGSGLGGQFWETDTLAVNTDGVISSFQNPAGTVDVPGKRLYITGVKIDSFVQTLLVTGGANEVWSLAFGHTTVSLATAESLTAGTKAPRRVPLGSRLKAAAAAALTQLATIQMDFSASPILVNPGEFLQTVKKNIGTVGTGGVVAHTVVFSGYFE